MRPEEFAHYVDSQLRNAIPRNILVRNLLAGGWTQAQIDEALKYHDMLVRNELSMLKRPVSQSILWVILILVIVAAVLFFMKYDHIFY